MLPSPVHALAVCLPFLGLAAPADADTWIVDHAGSGDFLQVQPAVDVSSDGDLIVLLPAPKTAYAGFVVAGKSVEIVAAEGAFVHVGSVEVRDLAPAQAVFLSGLRVTPDNFTAPHGIRAVNNAGSVRVDHCYFGTPDGSALEYSSDVVFSRSIVYASGIHSSLGPTGLSVLDSQLALYESEVRGGYGDWGTGGTGGTALVAMGAFVFLSSSSVEGGQGSIGDCWCVSPGDGGDGLHALMGTQVVAVDSEVESGPLGYCKGFCLKWGTPGDDWVIDGSSSYVEEPGPTRKLSAAPTAREGEGVEIRLEGEPGDEVFLFRASGSSFLWRPRMSGVVHLAPPVVTPPLTLGVVPPTGVLELLVPAGDLPGNDRERVQYVQAVVYGASGPPSLTAGVPFVVVEDELPQPCRSVVHVDIDAPPGGDGSSWASAFDDLADGLWAARADLDGPCPWSQSDVWVAEGTYLAPPSGFSVAQGIAVYGGFAGTETQLDQRDPTLHPTVLTGDVNGDDQPGFVNISDNRYRILRLNDSSGSVLVVVETLVDGLVVTGAAEHGLWCDADTARVEHCRFVGNYSPTRGGAVEKFGHLNELSISRCTFEGNFAVDRGGAVYGFPVTIADCRFIANETAGQGGALYVGGSNYDDAWIADCSFVGNLAGQGGGLAIPSLDHDMHVSGCTFVANEASFSGGGISVLSGHATVEDSILWGNSALGGQGEDDQIAGGSFDVDYTCVEGWTGAFGGVGNHGFDPLFVDVDGPDDVPGNADDDLRLGPGSPCVDAGDNGAVFPDLFDLDGDGDRSEPIPLDLDGLPRFIDDPSVPDTGQGTPPIVDMGAHERRPG